MDILNPILNLEKQTKCKLKYLYMPRNMEIVNDNQSPLHNGPPNGDEKT
jgi:hypothetical protein